MAETLTLQPLRPAWPYGTPSLKSAEARTDLHSPSLRPWLESMAQFSNRGKLGVENVRLRRKSKYATAGVFVPASVRAERPAPLRGHLATNIAAAIQVIIERAEMAGDSPGAIRLLADVKRGTDQFKR